MKVANVDTRLYYNPEPIISRNKMVNMIVGGCGTGKTYGIKKRVGMQNFLNTDGEEQFLFVRRHKTELDKIDGFFAPFFNDSDERLRSDWAVDKRNQRFIYKGKVCGHYSSLHQLMQKGSEFPMVSNIIFDEFITHGGYQRYLPDEINCFFGMVDAVCRYVREVHVYMMANAVSMYNPYFLELGYQYSGREFWVAPSHVKYGLASDTCVQFLKSALTEQLADTRFGRLIRGTDYGNYSLYNEALDGNCDFISKKTRYSQLYAVLHIEGNSYGVWHDPQNKHCTISPNCGNGDCIHIAYGPQDMGTGRVTVKAAKGTAPWVLMVSAYNYGFMYYEDLNCRSAVIKVLKRGFY